jgi:glycosyltransferase involved in cell wall biosynthesis
MIVPNLLIYIPTFNRPKQLRKQLQALVPQVRFQANRVRVVVSDNCSTEPEVAEVLNEFSYSRNIEIRVRSSNIEANANILMGFTEAQIDEYLWLLADDTLVARNAISTLLEVIDHKSPDLIALHSDKQETFPSVLKWDRQTFETILSDYQWGLISSAIYDMGYFSTSIGSAFTFHNSSFPHLGVLFSEFKNRKVIELSWLPEDKLHQGNMVDLPSDYSLALCGFPHLFVLFSGKDRMALLRSWVKRYGVAFLHSASRHEVSSLATKEMIRESSVPVRIQFKIVKFEYFLRRSIFGRQIEFFMARNPKFQTWLTQRYARLPFRIHSMSNSSPQGGSRAN